MDQVEFSLDGQPFIPLYSLLKVEGLCESGAMAKQVIDAEMVTVDGEIETRKRCKITAGKTVEFNGNRILVTP